MVVVVALKARGKRIYSEFKSTDPAVDALALEAARCADRCDVLERFSAGAPPLVLLDLVKEARMQQGRLDALVSRLMKVRAQVAAESEKAPVPVSGEGLASVTPLAKAQEAARKARRRA